LSNEAQKIQIAFGKPILGDEEKAAVARVLSGTQLVHGPEARRFEADFASFVGGGTAIAVGNCTAALHLSYVHLGIGAGDEVIVPAQTHVATAHAVAYTGATPVFADCDAATGNVTADTIAPLITPRTKAICVVHYLGLPVDMDPIVKLANDNKLFLVEDAALSLGGTYKNVHTGLVGDVGCFSFYPVKHITTSEGGMFLTKHADVAARVQRLRSFGYDKQVGERTVPGHYDVDLLGYNYRLSEMACAIGVEQLKRLPVFLIKRAENYAALSKALAGTAGITVIDSHGDADRRGSHYCLAIVLSDRLAGRRREIIAGINGRGVGTSIYYPTPVGATIYYRGRAGASADAYLNAHRISSQSIALPVGPHLNVGDMARVAEAVKAAIRENGS
jgi:dTDP-4-amino-4,6-dideoxygalactose transaminase